MKVFMLLVCMLLFSCGGGPLLGEDEALQENKPGRMKLVSTSKITNPADGYSIYYQIVVDTVSGNEFLVARCSYSDVISVSKIDSKKVSSDSVKSSSW